MSKFKNVYELLANASATGNPVRWPGGEGVFKVEGTLNGATVALKYLGPDVSTWRSVGTDTTITDLAVSSGGVFVLDECMIKAEVTGGTPSGLYATAGHTGQVPN